MIEIRSVFCTSIVSVFVYENEESVRLSRPIGERERSIVPFTHVANDDVDEEDAYRYSS